MTTSEDAEALVPAWSALHAASVGASPFQHPSFVFAWLRTAGARRSPVLLSVRTGDALVGVIALELEFAAARLLGDPEVSDYGPILAAPGAEAAVARGLMEWLAEDMTPAVSLWGIDAASPLRQAFQDLAEGLGWEVTEEQEAVAPAVDLPATFEDYVAALPKKDRHELRRKLRNLEAAGDLTFEDYTSPGDVAANFDRFLELMRTSRADKAEFLSPETESFFRTLAAASAEAGFMHLSTLLLDGEALAMTWAFETGGVTWLYNSSYHPGHPGLSLGIVSKAHDIRSAIERGNRTFSFLRGDEDYKRRLGGEPRSVVRLHLRQRG